MRLRDCPSRFLCSFYRREGASCTSNVNYILQGQPCGFMAATTTAGSGGLVLGLHTDVIVMGDSWCGEEVCHCGPLPLGAGLTRH